MKLGCFFAGFIAGFSVLFAQEVSIEDSYLNTTEEMLIIQAFSESDDLEKKLEAIGLIEELLRAGKRGDGTKEVLKRLSLEGTLIKQRKDGRVANNFPLVRERAAGNLGNYNDDDTRAALGQILMIDPEPAVVTAALRSLTYMNAFDDGSFNRVRLVFSQYDSFAKEDRLAHAALDYFEKCPPGKPAVYQALMVIVNSPKYVRVIRDRADRILKQKMNARKAASRS